MRNYRLALAFALLSLGCGSDGGDKDPAPGGSSGAGGAAAAAGGGSGSGGSETVQGGGGSGGSGVPADKANGDICTSAAECSSGICEESAVGEMHCYGDVKPDETCGDTFDCNGGVCIERSLTGTASVCNVGLTVCFDKAVSPECTAFVVDFCRLVQFCGAEVSSNVPAAYASLDQCIGVECTSALDGSGDLTPAQCLQGSNAILGGAACP
jgi:hypothetical protein